MDHGSHVNGKRGPLVSRINIVLIVFLAVGGFYLATEHRAHLYGFWPLLFVFPCLIMHLFMSHGDHEGTVATVEAQSKDQPHSPQPLI
jgi:hypothetical protein